MKLVLKVGANKPGTRCLDDLAPGELARLETGRIVMGVMLGLPVYLTCDRGIPWFMQIPKGALRDPLTESLGIIDEIVIE